MITIPLIAGNPYYRVATSIEGVTYVFVVRWNRRDQAWYFDIFDAQNTLISRAIKIVLGGYLGRASNHPLFRGGVFVAADTSGAGQEATFDDLGSRVELRYLTALYIAGKLDGQLA